MKIILITEAQSSTLLEVIHHYGMDYEFVPQKNELQFARDGSILLKIRLPIHFSSPNEFRQNSPEKIPYVLSIIRSGMAAVGYFEEGRAGDHKVFRAYMVRKKQGKSQLQYLKTKGKSRAGSRLRLAKSLEFFKDINLRLHDYFGQYRIDRIGLSCPTTLIPYFFGSTTIPPFRKNDPRILKIPKHVQSPTYEALLETNDFLLKGEIRYSLEGEALLKEFQHALNKNETDPEDAW